MLTDFLWNVTLMATCISIIAHTLYTFGILKPMKIGKNEAPATFTSTWQNANGFMNQATKMASTFQSMLENQGGEGGEKTE